MIKTMLIILGIIVVIIFVLWYAANFVDDSEDSGSVVSFIKKMGDLCCLGGSKK